MRFASVGFCLLILLSCAPQISIKKASTDEYLHYPPERYMERDKKLLRADVEQKNQLFKAALECGNHRLAAYYLRIGANVLHVIRGEDEKREYLETLTERDQEDDRRELLFESVSRFPKIFRWDLRWENGSWITGLVHFSYTLRPEVFDEVLLWCEDLDKQTRRGYSTLSFLSAAMDSAPGKKERLLTLLRAGCDTSLTSEHGDNVLHLFAWMPFDEDFSEVLEMILETGLDINGQNTMGETPLHKAVFPNGLRTNSKEYIQFLLEHGAQKNISDNYNAYPVDWVSYFERGLESASPEKQKQILQTMDELRALLDTPENIPLNYR